jgi:hypothetical protein
MEIRSRKSWVNFSYFKMDDTKNGTGVISPEESQVMTPENEMTARRL